MRVKTPTKIFAKPGEKSPMQKPKEIKRRNIKFAFLPLSSIHIDVSNSTIQDFSFLERFSRLASIDARNTLIQNVQSAPLRPLIEYISLDDSPITMQPFYRLMLLCTIGNQIQSIDGVSVTNEEKEQGKKLLPVIQKYLYDGYAIKSIDPLVVIRGETEIEIDPETGEKLSETEIKINQTTIIIEEFAKQVNEVKSEMGLDNKEVVVEEIMKSPQKVDYSPYLSPSKFHVEPPPEEISPFKKAFNKHLSPKDYLKANDIYNSPEKRRETQMEITTMMESHGILSDEIDLLATPLHQHDNEIPSELHIDTQLEEEELGDAEIIPVSAENADLIDTTKSAADIFEAASVITSPHKAMDLARKSQKAKSKIPTRISSPVKDVYEDKCIMPPLSPVLKSIVMEEDDQDIAAKEEEFRRELRFFPSPRASRKRDSFINEDETLNDQNNEEEEKKVSEDQEDNVHKEEQSKDINEEEEKKEEVCNEKVEETKEIEIHEAEEKIEDAHPEEEQNKEDTHDVDKNKENACEEEDKKEIENAATDGDDKKTDEVHREEEDKNEVKDKVEEMKDEISNEEEAEKENIQEQYKNENHEEEQKEQTIIDEENKVNVDHDHEQEDEKNEVHEEEEKKENENLETEEQTEDMHEEDKKESVNESAEEKREENETHDEEEKKEFPEAVDEVSNEEKPTNEEEGNSDNKIELVNEIEDNKESKKEDNENLNHEEEKTEEAAKDAEVKQKDDNKTQEASVEKAQEEEDNKENVLNEKTDAEEKNNNDDEQDKV